MDLTLLREEIERIHQNKNPNNVEYLVSNMLKLLDKEQKRRDSQHKIDVNYRELNRDYINQRQRIYYSKNREAICERQNERAKAKKKMDYSAYQS